MKLHLTVVSIEVARYPVWVDGTHCVTKNVAKVHLSVGSDAPGFDVDGKVVIQMPENYLGPVIGLDDTYPIEIILPEVEQDGNTQAA